MMTFCDMITMSVGNLLRRRLRTFLTMLGVLIGTTSIVAMLSIGNGMQEMIMSEYEGYGGLTQITVTKGQGSDDAKTASDKTQLTETNIKKFAAMEHVEAVNPMLTFDLTLEQGRYTGWSTLKGVDAAYLQTIKIGQGVMPQAKSGALEVLAGNSVTASFWDPNDFEGTSYYMTNTLLDIDLLGRVTKFITYNYNQGSQITADTEQTSEEDPAGDASEELTTGDSEIRLNLKVTGVMEGDPNSYSQDSDAILVDIDALKQYLTKHFKRGSIPGQPLNAKGRPYREWVYDSVTVQVDDADNVEQVQDALRDMGFSTESNKAMLESAQNVFRIIELVLGAIGMIAFLVAAIGIANTMMMSIYERTKEIGVMKVLGCDMKDIQRLFLTEAGFIGLTGGAVGVLLTCGLSMLANSLAKDFIASEMGVAGARISIVTPGLACISVVFATLMGMLAGYFPAKRAMKLSPLAAIRTE